MGARGRKSAADLAMPPVRPVEPFLDNCPEIPPPGHLSPEMQTWWRAVVRDYELDQHHLKLLEAAADSWDRMVMARTTIIAEGLTVETAHGKKQHPAVNVERDSRLGFARLLRELDLDCEPPKEQAGWRPP